jgi:L-lactate dehydrogenase complex protein LldF
VKIDIPSILVHLRTEHVEAQKRPTPESIAMAAVAYTMDHPRLYAAAQRAARLSRLAGRRGRGLPPPLNRWTASRDLPDPPEQTFRDWWARR